MKRDNIVEFKETVEVFITDTISYLKNNIEVINKVTTELENDFNKVKIIGIYNRLGDE